jgi:hypothetical protein
LRSPSARLAPPPPAFIASKPGGFGFAEIAERVLQARPVSGVDDESQAAASQSR